MRTFIVERRNDESGISGTGIVIEGAQFSNGEVVMRWMTDPGSLVVWHRFHDFWNICVEGHPTNNTIVTFSDGVVLDQAEIQRERAALGWNSSS